MTSNFPKKEIFGLTSQMRRAAISVPSNIVEGCARLSVKDYCWFLEIAYASLKELHYQFSVAERLEYFDKDFVVEGNNRLLETERVLGSLLHKMWKTKPYTIIVLT